MMGAVVRKLRRALGAGLYWILLLLAWLASLGLCAITVTWLAPISSIVLTLLLLWTAIVLHEAGHYVGARHAGMRVLRIWASFVEIAPQRRGFRWRWRPRGEPRQRPGAVLAVRAPGVATRRDELWFIVGGPAANLAVAALAGLVAWLCWPAPAVGVVLAFATLNTALGLGNLVPRLDGGHPSDGLHLLLRLRGVDEQSEAGAFARTLSLSVFGTTADALPTADLDALERQPQPAPLRALWFRVKGAQARGAWDETPALAACFATQVQAFDPAWQRYLRGLIEALRVELAFSESVRLRDDAPLRDLALSNDVAWNEPALRPRLDALRAALAGDLAACERALDETRRIADNEVDSTGPNEARIATALRERFGLAVPAGSAG